MAGRAGRRGIDTIGHVIHCNNLFDLPSQTEYRDILCGKAQNLVSKFRISYSWVLSLSVPSDSEKGEENTNIYSLSKKSMIYEELQRTIIQQKITMESLQKDILSQQSVVDKIKYSAELCRNYTDIKNTIDTFVNKKKKEKQRELENLETEYPSISEDAKLVQKLDSLVAMKKKEEDHLCFLETYMETQIEKVRTVLQENDYIGFDRTLSTLGSIAAKMSEVHPLVWSKCITTKWNYLSGFSTKQIVGILSCITDIKIPEEHKRYSILTLKQEKVDVFLQERLKELQEEYAKFEQIECDRQLRTGMNYLDVIAFDILEESMKWCDCNSEEECKTFISTELSKKDIGVGDFTKAMLKIATVAREWSVIPEIMENVDLSYKLSQVDTMVLKYIATNQSLYV
jgi:superfamily II RNA helicase